METSDLASGFFAVCTDAAQANVARAKGHMDCA
jgi:hypothetical protein